MRWPSKIGLSSGFRRGVRQVHVLKPLFFNAFELLGRGLFRTLLCLSIKCLLLLVSLLNLLIIPFQNLLGVLENLRGQTIIVELQPRSDVDRDSGLLGPQLFIDGSLLVIFNVLHFSFSNL